MSPRARPLDAVAPRFALPEGAIRVLRTPKQFYAQLREHIRSARRRVFLASLYIGAAETQLVADLDDSLARSPQLQVHILTDGLRGTREAPRGASTASLLAPLAAKYPARVHVRQYVNPHLRGLRRRLIPKRFDEGWGLQHMKLYGADDRIILSGANLSAEYFTNRQDRYIDIADASVTDYFFRVFDAVSRLSFTLRPRTRAAATTHDNFDLVWDSESPDPRIDLRAYLVGCRQLLLPLVAPTPGARPPSPRGTLVYPVLQFTPLIGRDASNDLAAMELLLRGLRPGQRWALTAGYFNIIGRLQRLLLQSEPAAADVIVAGEQANGFYRSHGLSRYIPEFYSHIAYRFARAAQRARPAIKTYEWTRGVVHEPGGWSYHAKGIWIWPPEHGESPVAPGGPCVTVVGSSNYTERSYSRDLEAGAVLVTDDPGLRAQLQREFDGLKEHAREKSPRDLKRGSLFVRLCVRFLGDKF